MHNRAVQFTPFAALRGYYDLLRGRERVRVPKKELMEDAAEILSRKLALLEKGQMVEVIHYADGEYIATQGIATRIDKIGRKLTIVKTEIDFAMIYSLQTI